ncbi:hypothetical protein E1281_36130 [Actinomadura sp. KC345]|uniref:hypothetical protein n=1 Tax=Actinomadura sp. KC345 TaxID=2530371 RepID=UPI001046ABB3|nr:hypothetical protein [Actinomadura sp. KC345]TDC42487.1 hypothetical protein E1281_36130 [Actinomadura sp. KC345]
MHKLSDYVLAVRTTGSPPAPEGIKTVDLVPGESGDPIADTIAGLRASGLTAADFRSRVIFLAPEGIAGLVPYAALCGFAGRRVDAYADGAVLEFSRLAPDGEKFADAGRPPGHLMWGQVGGPEAEGMPTAHVDAGSQRLLDPAAVTVIRYAARLRMVPPDAARDALATFVLVAAIRRRSDDRFPYLSTGTEPVPSTKDDPEQGTDLEKLRREAAAYRQELRSERRGADMLPPSPVSAHNKRIAEAKAVDVRTVLTRLGSFADDDGLWHCPRPRKHSNGDENPSMKVYGDNRTRCHRCDAEKVGPIRLVIEVLGVTPDEAANFILDSDRVVDMRAS